MNRDCLNKHFLDFVTNLQSSVHAKYSERGVNYKMGGGVCTREDSRELRAQQSHRATVFPGLLESKKKNEATSKGIMHMCILCKASCKISWKPPSILFGV